MKLKLFVAVLAATALAGCNLTAPDETVFTPRSVSPAPGSVINVAGKTTIAITGALTVQEGLYHSMAYVRDDGATFMQGVWGPAAQLDAWDKDPFTQDVDYYFAEFCANHTVEKAVFIASTSDILRKAVASEPAALSIFRNFPWHIADYRVDIPLDYTCR